MAATKPVIQRVVRSLNALDATHDALRALVLAYADNKDEEFRTMSLTTIDLLKRQLDDLREDLAP